MRPGQQGRKRGTGTCKQKKIAENRNKFLNLAILRSTMQHPFFFHYSYDYGGIFFRLITTIVVVMFGLNT